MTELQQAARQALALMDLTSLNNDDNDTVIRELCARANTPAGHPAAVCVYPAFVSTARQALAEQGLAGKVKVATVTNFPHGEADVERAAAETRAAIAAGADEVDVVFPYRALMAGDAEVGRELVEACKRECGDAVLKVILETGELKEAGLIDRAGMLAIDGGADFLKTSTGKVAVNATLDAAKILLTAIKASGRDVGFKAAGGVRTAEDAAAYLQLAERVMGAEWITPAHFRFGASGLLGSLLETLGVEQDKGSTEGY
ncbi:deoxyribose-phosphate aldolase [Billgrantia desiderata]|uniref:Deoxyribose-phosphate aldolase n=1 Tax=Billgrantia desiderata TaxID=52021 RepID=A0ABS9B8B4_9GAMM|nr:deoxyribose-phosphate aldolase [Halomonas desiderata]MCE8013791.1 deoxyribose-phosphate aldolase [Halomonas desiderata]MCE8030503.1 deoxyribose-phosphate aldolase [Halomonas desiderata]MCE8043732.1 deoxyribose-phosphate aldolase [Halomonas desiderata]MCE8048306.1 deoxyribose-phosphate aldolase [Halomonas desiderata]OUE40444.1 deoxyribose-phosphate aldolase [Halomonas desiderata SP1]